MSFRLDNITIDWIGDEKIHLDGGAMFGVVPKALWSKEYPCDSQNLCPLANSPILIRKGDKKILLESGLGNKMNPKIQEIYRVQIGKSVVEGLREINVTPEEIDLVVLSHMDWDHVSGLTYLDEEKKLRIRFPNAMHICSKQELSSLLNPDHRSKKGYWAENYELLLEGGLLKGVEDDYTIDDYIQLKLTGGHRAGHILVRIEEEGSIAYYLGDLLPTKAHYNPLWVSAYDDYPLTSIEMKEYWLLQARREKAWLLFYHDINYQAALFDLDGRIIKSINRGVRLQNAGT